MRDIPEAREPPQAQRELSWSEYFFENPMIAVALLCLFASFMRRGYRFISRRSGNTFLNNTGYTGPKDTKNRYHGKGVLIYPNGDKYTGNFTHGIRHGHGVYEFTAGGSYIGAFVNGVYEGKGRETYATGSFYVGQFKAGVRHGVGSLTYASGPDFAYDGEWAHGSKNGFGAVVQRSGSRSIGSFSEGKCHGECVHLSAGPPAFQTELSALSGNDVKSCQLSDGKILQSYVRYTQGILTGVLKPEEITVFSSKHKGVIELHRRLVSNPAELKRLATVITPANSEAMAKSGKNTRPPGASDSGVSATTGNRANRRAAERAHKKRA
jgi:hypothetical protein